MEKKEKRLRRSRRGRCLIQKLNAVRLSVHRTSQHIYAQIIEPTNAKVLVSVSTLDKTLRSSLKNGGNTAAATEVGKEIAKRALKAGIKEVAFDRSGFRYHGRVKALADAAREAGLIF